MDDPTNLNVTERKLLILSVQDKIVETEFF